jgi:hypothetical protein
LWRTCRDRIPTDEYKDSEKKVRNLIRNAKKRFEKKLASGNGGQKRPFFAYIKKRTQSRPSVGPLKTEDGQTVADSEGIANLLNRAFKEVFTREDTTSMEDMNMDSTLETVRFTEREICRKIQNPRSEAASGPDGIGPKILQELREELAAGLAHIFTKSLEEGAVPADWKEANVTRVFKKGAKSKPENYRPVSLTSVSWKIMESIIRDAMTEHLQNCNLIKKSQHGFLKDQSCFTKSAGVPREGDICGGQWEGLRCHLTGFCQGF